MQQEFYYVIIGNGIAGLNAAEAIRQNDAYRTIAVISDENYLTYRRLVLSHHLGENILPETLYIHPQSWYDKENISMILNTKTIGIDTDGKVLKTDKGDVNYTKLIIASGSYCFIPPVDGFDKKGVFALRGMDDLIEINHAIEQSSKAIVIGGGLLGLESAWGIKQKGIDVTVLEFFPRILPRQMDDEGSTMLKGIIENLGIELYLGVEAANISGNDKADGVVLKDGRSISGDFVLFSSGVRPHVEFVKDTPISINKGIVVDEYMRTDVPDIYAAGDVAEYKGAIPGIWPIASAQGKIAGINAAGGQEKYKTIPPSNTLKVMGIDCFSVGNIDNRENRFKEIKYAGDTEYYKLFLDGNRLVGAIMLGDISKSIRLRSFIEQGKDMSDYLVSDNAKEIIEKL